MVNRVYIVTHNDLDGVASAAIFRYLAMKAFKLSGESVQISFVEPVRLVNLLTKSIKYERESHLAIMDLGMNEDMIHDLKKIFAKLAQLDINVEWYDHHVWRKEWIEELASIGVKLYIDTSVCAAGVVYRYALPAVEREDCHLLLIEDTCSADLWRWDTALSPLLYRMTRMPRGRSGDAFRRYLVEEFSECRIFSDSLIERAENNFDAELRGYERALAKTEVFTINQMKVGMLYREMDHPGISLTANYLIGRLGLDLAIVIKPDGSISFRSKKGLAREYALCFGGGGHPNASGGKIELPIPLKLAAIVPTLKGKVLKIATKRKLSRCNPISNNIKSD